MQEGFHNTDTTAIDCPGGWGTGLKLREETGMLLILQQGGMT